MKKNILGPKLKRILAAFGCVILAFLVWLVIRYGQIEELPIVVFGFGL